MEEKKKSNVIKIVVGVIVVVLIVAIVLFANKQIEKTEQEKKLAEVKETVDSLKHLTPDSFNNSNNGITSKADTEIQDYINNYVVLENATVSKERNDMALKNIKIKNNGEKIITKLEITVYFQDEEGKDIAEDSVGIFETLKPNYSWQLDKNTYYPLNNIPDEASEERARIVITKVEF